MNPRTPCSQTFFQLAMGSEKSPLPSRVMCPHHRGSGGMSSKIPPKLHAFLIFKRQMIFQASLWSSPRASYHPHLSSLIKDLHHLFFPQPGYMVLSCCSSWLPTECETTYFEVQSFQNQPIVRKEAVITCVFSSYPCIVLKKPLLTFFLLKQFFRDFI